MRIYRKVVKFYKNFKKDKGVFGCSVKGRPLVYFKISKTPYPKLIVTGAIHAREHITSLLILKLIKNFIKNGSSGTVYFIPLVNPDGVEFSQKFRPLYKANARGVDLNVNFDARWATGAQNKREKGDSDYVGECPFSEPETVCLRDFTLSVKPSMTVSYHSKGQEIYYEFFQSEKDKERDKYLAEQVASVTGYIIKSTPDSAGGYKDWCIDKLNIPALTIEVGKDCLSHPIGKKHLKSIYKENQKVITTLIKGLEQINERKIYETCYKTSKEGASN